MLDVRCSHLIGAIIVCFIFLGGCASHLSNVPVDKSLQLSSSAPAGALLLSPGNTRIVFVGSSWSTSHEGTFTRFAGWIAPDGLSLLAEIDMNSVETQIDLLNKDLKQADYFDVANYPKAGFVSTRVETIKGNDRMVYGDMTLHGVTKAISFPATIESDAANITLEATMTIRQSDFKMESAKSTNDAVPVKVTVRVPRTADAH